SLVSNRLGAKLIPLQQRLTDHVQLLTRTTASFAAMERSARALSEAVLATEGWSGANLQAHTNADAAIKRLFDSALAAQASYARYLESLPSGPADLTKRRANAAIELADHAEVA